MTRSSAYFGEFVEVDECDHEDMPECLRLTLQGPAPGRLDSTPLTIEISRDEAREIIAGLAAVL
jgi:hypothetical protein